MAGVEAEGVDGPGEYLGSCGWRSPEWACWHDDVVLSNPLAVGRSPTGYGYLMYLPRYRTEPEHGPPENYMGASLGLDVMVARSPAEAIWLTSFVVYPTGWTFELHVQTADKQFDPEEACPLAGPDTRHKMYASPDRGARVSLECADGSLAATWPQDDDGAARRLQPMRGGGDPTHWLSSCWVWPLPPAGPMTFRAAWPARGLGEQTAVVDGRVFREAADKCVQLWDALPAEPEDEDADGT